jgi:tetratricopeptide (TPR) repeat protein
MVGQFDNSRETFEQIIDTYPESPFGPAGIATYHATVRGRLDEALSWSKKAIDLDPEGLTDVVGLSSYLTDLGDTDGAQSWLDRMDDLHTETIRFDVGMWYLSLRHNDAASALKYAQRVVEQAQSLRNVWDLLPTLRDDDLAQGRASVSLARYQTAYPEIFDAEPDINQSNFLPALDIAYLLLEMGRESEAQAILDRVIAVSKSIPLLGQLGTFVGNAPAYALMGRKTEALSEIRRGVDAGWRTYWWFYFDHYKPLESLRDEPEFKAMRAEVEADMAEQLARVQATKADRNLSLPK